MHWTHQKASIAGAVVYAAVKVGTDAEAPRTGRVICIERIQPISASRQENAVKKMGFNSTSHYQFCHFINVDDDYQTILNQAYEEWERLENEISIPYYPHVSVGWDNSPRTGKSAVTRENTPERFEAAIRKAKEYIDKRPNLHPLITINSWNEWTETSYLQPDNVYGYGYLDALKKVFVDEK